MASLCFEIDEKTTSESSDKYENIAGSASLSLSMGSKHMHSLSFKYYSVLI
jgi:hypothetical protein